MSRCGYCGVNCYGETCFTCRDLARLERERLELDLYSIVDEYLSGVQESEAVSAERETGRTGAPSRSLAADLGEAVQSAREKRRR